jgi:hypothetical protein
MPSLHNNSILTSPRQVTEVLLPRDFSPSPCHVLCARGKLYWDHPGNQKYREIIAAVNEKYSKANNKMEKTLIVSEIVEKLCKSCFVKKVSGRWVECDEHFCREKITQSLRDSLHKQYRSSTKAKKRRRAGVKISGDIDEVLHSNVSVGQRIEKLSQDVQKQGILATDLEIGNLFSQANFDILEMMKRDRSLLDRYQETTAHSN